MKLYMKMISMAAIVVMTTGCLTGDAVLNGLLIGGVGGATIGGATGNHHNRVERAVYGGLGGAALGAGVGYLQQRAADNRARQEHEWRMANDANYRLSQENQVRSERLNYDRTTLDLTNQRRELDAEQQRVNQQLGR